MSINVSYSSRYDNKKLHHYTNNLIADIQNCRLNSKAVYIVSEEYLGNVEHLVKNGNKLKYIDGYYVLLPTDSPIPFFQ